MDLFEEKFLANSMNSLTQQQRQEVLLKIEETFPLTPLHTWVQLQSKVHKMQRKFNQLKQEDGESDVGQCKWTWFVLGFVGKQVADRMCESRCCGGGGRERKGAREEEEERQESVI
jgi:hypothetical protein